MEESAGERNAIVEKALKGIDVKKKFKNLVRSTTGGLFSLT